jgi:NAD(P)-dependent dehydrogenase (short-subunit alcohol dehydrogenase family)
MGVEGGAGGEGSAVALVAGGVRGIGLAVARRLQARGDRVHITWRSSAELARERERELAGRVHRADLAEEGAAEELVGRVLERDGRLDWVVCAVGEFARGPLGAAPPELVRTLFASNVDVPLALARAAREPLRASRGALVFFGTAGLAGLRGRRTTAVYSAAKSALVVLARSLALEEAPHGVRVNVLSPGIVPHEHAEPGSFDPDRLARVPLGRPGEPSEVAEAAAWLCSPASSYVTGAELEISGGWSP